MHAARVDRRIIGVEDHESGVGFLKNVSVSFFATKDRFSQKEFFYKVRPKGTRPRSKNPVRNRPIPDFSVHFMEAGFQIGLNRLKSMWIRQ